MAARQTAGAGNRAIGADGKANEAYSDEMKVNTREFETGSWAILTPSTNRDLKKMKTTPFCLSGWVMGPQLT